MTTTEWGELTWEPVGDIRWSILCWYTEREERDWRWLWLRKRTVTRLVGWEQAGNGPEEAR